MSSYIGNQPSGQGQAERFIFTATGTTPTITHDTAGVPLSYTPGHCSVYLNGVKQVVGTDVTATNGSTIVFAADLVIGDVVELIALSTFSAAETEGTSIKSTGVTGTTKYLRADGDGTASWQLGGADFSAVGEHILPSADDTYDLGSGSYQWRNIYTGDLHLKNDRGSWTVIEESQYLTLRNNTTNKIYKIMMEEV